MQFLACFHFHNIGATPPSDDLAVQGRSPSTSASCQEAHAPEAAGLEGEA